MPQPLFAAEITLCCLSGDVAEQELNLVKFAARQMTEVSACSSEVVTRKLLYFGDHNCFPNHFSKHLRRHARSPSLTRAAAGHASTLAFET
jgi:hypothetical protein